MKTSADYRSGLSPSQKCLAITAAFVFLVSCTCLALSGYHTNDHCSVQVYDSPSVDCSEAEREICSDAPAVKFQMLTLTPNLAVYHRIRCSWRTRAAVLSIIAAVACMVLSLIFLGLVWGGSSRGWAIPIVILYILTLFLLIAAIVLEGKDLTRGRRYASDYVENAPNMLQTNQPGVDIIYRAVDYSRGSYIATIVLFNVVLVGLTALLISYLSDRRRAPSRNSIPATMGQTTSVMKAPPTFQPVVAAPMKKVEVVDVRRTEQHLGVPAPHTQISAPYTTGGRQEGMMVDISQEPPANRINISA